jgi:hypothetical protein
MNRMIMSLIFLFTSSCDQTLAEELVCPVGYTCSIPLDKKISRSFEDAVYVLKGEFRLEGEKPELQRVSDELVSITNLHFDVDEVLKGELSENVIKLKIVVASESEKRESALSKESYTEMKEIVERRLYNLERAYESGDIEHGVYEEEKSSLKDEIHALASSNRVFAMPVRPGELDRPYRDAVVLVDLNSSYYLFLFSRENALVYPWQVDLYPAEEYAEQIEHSETLK